MADFAKVITPRRAVEIPLAVGNFGKLYKELFESAPASGHEVWTAYSHNNFDNPFQKADEALYKKIGWWVELFRDIVARRNPDKGEITDGRLPLYYIANAGTSFEQYVKVLAPVRGWYVPTGDGWFFPGTLIPFETVGNKETAIKRLEAKGVPNEQVSFFNRLDNYDVTERFVGRCFYPGWHDDGRFYVDSYGHPGFPGYDKVGVRSADEHRIVMEASSLEGAKTR